MRDLLGNIYLVIVFPAMLVGCIFLGIKNVIKAYKHGLSIEAANERYDIEADDFLDKIGKPLVKIWSL